MILDCARASTDGQSVSAQVNRLQAADRESVRAKARGVKLGRKIARSFNAHRATISRLGA